MVFSFIINGSPQNVRIVRPEDSMSLIEKIKYRELQKAKAEATIIEDVEIRPYVFEDEDKTNNDVKVEEPVAISGNQV